MEHKTEWKPVDEHMVAIPKPNKANECKAGEETESCSALVLPHLIAALVSLLMVLLVLAGPVYEDYRASLDLNPAVLSSFASSKKINGSHLTASWDITLDPGIEGTISHCSVEYERVDASLINPSRQDDDLVASTWLFPTRQIKYSDIKGIQVRAEDAEVAEDRFDLSRVGVSIRVWARAERMFFSDQYYFIRIDCNPDWIGSSELTTLFSMEAKKCQVHTKQIKSYESWKTMHITSDNNEIKG
ncbi:hypothetical protein LINGRAHAP2_LOCUS13007 [Linum grandiflorum]